MEWLVVAVVIVLGLGAVFWIMLSNEARGLGLRNGGDGGSSGFTAYNGDDDDADGGDVGGGGDGDGGGNDGGGGDGGGGDGGGGNGGGD